MYSPFPRRKPRKAAQCKHPSALRPGLSLAKAGAHQGKYKGKMLVQCVDYSSGFRVLSEQRSRVGSVPCTSPSSDRIRKSLGCANMQTFSPYSAFLSLSCWNIWIDKR